MRRAFTGAMALTVLVSGALAQSFFDDFNRADGPLGANYDLISGTMPVVSSNMAAGAASGNGLTLVNAGLFSNGYDQTEVSADLSLADASATLAYCALSLGSDGMAVASHGIFVKLQRQVAGGFSHIGFYTGQGSNTSAIVTPGGNFQALASPITSGRLRIVCTSSTNLYTGIDTNFDNVDDVTYNSTLVFPTLVVGNRVGLHVYGALGRIDNYGARGLVPEPATMAVLGLGAAALIRRRRK